VTFCTIQTLLNISTAVWLHRIYTRAKCYTTYWMCACACACAVCQFAKAREDMVGLTCGITNGTVQVYVCMSVVW